MIGGRAREAARVALRLAGAGVVGTAIGVAGRRFALADLADVMQLPVWESARRLAATAPALQVPPVRVPPMRLPSLAPSPEMVPVVALFVLALGLAAVAGFLWTRASSSSVDAARAPRLDVAALTARCGSARGSSPRSPRRASTARRATARTRRPARPTCWPPRRTAASRTA